jgi:hypothetical protein
VAFVHAASISEAEAVDTDPILLPSTGEYDAISPEICVPRCAKILSTSAASFTTISQLIACRIDGFQTFCQLARSTQKV